MVATTEVQRRPGRGRCLIAADNLNVGDLVFAVQPLSAVLEEGQARENCANCFSNTRGNSSSAEEGCSRCSGCKSDPPPGREEHNSRSKDGTAGGRGQGPPPVQPGVASSPAFQQSDAGKAADLSASPRRPHLQQRPGRLEEPTSSSQARIWYCSRSCQKMDWREHRQECKAWNTLDSARTPTRTLRLAGRILTAMNRSDKDGKSGRVREAVADLVHHNEERTPQQQEQYMLMATFVARVCVAGCGEGALTWPSACGRGFPGLVDAAYAVVGKLSCNVFSIVLDVGARVVGCGLYLEAATANHSCMPNAAQSFDGRELSLRCTRPIMKGEEITIGITELHKPGSARRESLRASYFFECHCDRCDAEGAGVEDAWLEGYACPDKPCPGVCAKRPSGSAREISQDGENVGGESGRPDLTRSSEAEDPARLRCGKCGASRSTEEAEREGKAINELLERGKALGREGDAAAGKDCLEEALQRAKLCLHRGNSVLSDVYAELSSVCLELQDFEAAATHACDGIATHRACFSGLLPYFAPWANHLGIAGKFVLCVRRHPNEALLLLEEAAASIQVTHGVKHPFYREIRDLLGQARAGG